MFQMRVNCYKDALLFTLFRWQGNASLDLPLRVQFSGAPKQAEVPTMLGDTGDTIDALASYHTGRASRSNI